MRLSRLAPLARPKVLAPLGVIAFAVAIALVLMANRPIAESTRPIVDAPVVQVVRVEPVSVELSIAAHGTVEPGTESDLVTEVSGRIVWVSPELGSGGFFDPEEVLVRIDPRDYQVSLRGAEAARQRVQSDLTLAQANLQRQRSMRQTGASSRSRLDEAIHAEASAAAGLLEAEVAVERAGLDLARTEIRAPFTGRVRDKHVDVGQFVGRGVPVARVYSVDYAEIRLPIRDRDLAFLDLPIGRSSAANDEVSGTSADAPRTEVTLRASYGGRDHAWQGYVVRTEGALDPRTRMLHVVVRVDDPYGRQAELPVTPLPVGLFVDAAIRGRRIDGAFEVPRAALRRHDEVLVVDADDRLRIRRVEVLRSESEISWIVGGLASGERVVSTPLEVATEGMKVRADEVPLESARAALPRGPFDEGEAS